MDTTHPTGATLYVLDSEGGAAARRTLLPPRVSPAHPSLYGKTLAPHTNLSMPRTRTASKRRHLRVVGDPVPLSICPEKVEQAAIVLASVRALPSRPSKAAANGNVTYLGLAPVVHLPLRSVSDDLPPIPA